MNPFVDYAVLNSKMEVITCGQQRYRTWMRLRGGERKSRIRIDRINDWIIETRFTGERWASDFSQFRTQFWKVSLSRTAAGRNELAQGAPGSFLAALNAEIDACFHRVQSLEEALKAPAPVLLELCFTTLEEALKFHALARKRVRAKERLSGNKPEESQQLLAQLSSWCEQKWGRQAQVAREVGTSPSAVNDWLNARKKMTGEQALRVRKLLHKAGCYRS